MGFTLLPPPTIIPSIVYLPTATTKANKIDRCPIANRKENNHYGTLQFYR